MVSLHTERVFSANDVKSLSLLYDYFQIALGDDDTVLFQQENFEAICNRLNLTTGEKLLDIGGELVIYAARKYGANVLGVTLNKLLHMKFNQAIAASCLKGSAVKFMDYRNLVSVSFDKAVCLNPFGAMKRKEMMTLLGTIYNLLHPGGLFLTQCITTSSPLLLEKYRLRRYIGSIIHGFTGNGFLPFNDIELIARQMGFVSSLTINLSDNYQAQLSRWSAYLELNRDEIVSNFSEDTLEQWAVAISGLVDRLEQGDLQICQYLCSKPDNGPKRVLLPDSQRCCGLRNSEKDQHETG